jgi:hypothetical protein
MQKEQRAESMDKKSTKYNNFIDRRMSKQEASKKLQSDPNMLIYQQQANQKRNKPIKILVNSADEIKRAIQTAAMKHRHNPNHLEEIMIP